MTKFILIVSISVLLQACQSIESQSIEQGKKLFNQVHIGKNNVIGCISCHSLKPEIATVGPSLFGLNLRAEYLVPNLNAQQYIKQSIINPDAYIVSGYSPAIMFAHYEDELTQEEIDALVQYLRKLN